MKEIQGLQLNDQEIKTLTAAREIINNLNHEIDLPRISRLADAFNGIGSDLVNGGRFLKYEE